MPFVNSKKEYPVREKGKKNQNFTMDTIKYKETFKKEIAWK